MMVGLFVWHNEEKNNIVIVVFLFSFTYMIMPHNMMILCFRLQYFHVPIVLWFLHSTLVVSSYIDVVLTLSIKHNISTWHRCKNCKRLFQLSWTKWYIHQHILWLHIYIYGLRWQRGVPSQLMATICLAITVIYGWNETLCPHFLSSNGKKTLFTRWQMGLNQKYRSSYLVLLWFIWKHITLQQPRLRKHLAVIWQGYPLH